MNGVIGMTGLLLDTELTPQQREYADAVRRSGEALLAIINDILDFSKIEAGKLELEFDRGRSPRSRRGRGRAAGRAGARQGPGAGGRGATRRAAGMLGDPGRMRQVLMNLVGNAVKFTERGEVVVRTCAWPSRRPTSATGPLRGHRHRHRHLAGGWRRGCSSPSPRPTARRRASTAGPASGWRSASGWWS